MCMFEVKQLILEDHEDVEGKSNQIHLESVSHLKPLLAETELMVMPLADQRYRFQGMLESCDHVFLGTDEFRNLDALTVDPLYDQLSRFDIAIKYIPTNLVFFARLIVMPAGFIYRFS